MINKPAKIFILIGVALIIFGLSFAAYTMRHPKLQLCAESIQNMQDRALQADPAGRMLDFTPGALPRAKLCKPFGLISH
jgi:hypothetical protein